MPVKARQVSCSGVPWGRKRAFEKPILSAELRKANAITMAAIAKAMTDDEMKSAAEYYASMKWTPWVKVIETPKVPKTLAAGGVYLQLEDARTEAIGSRIVETPEDTEHFETFRDPRMGFIAYVPPVSIEKGEKLVKTGGGAGLSRAASATGRTSRASGHPSSTPTVVSRRP